MNCPSYGRNSAFLDLRNGECKIVDMISSVFRRKATKLVAVVVPMSNRSELTPEEEISFKHLIYFLGKYDKYLVVPKNLRINFPGFGIKRFDNKFFGSAVAHSKLLLSPTFYKAFIDYRFILIYHLDALVFSDQLTQWCEMDFDFIGAPWIKYEGAPYSGMAGFEGKVGNGGFSLRKTESFLKVINSSKYYVDPVTYRKTWCAPKPKYLQWLNLPKKFLKCLGVRNNARWEMCRYRKPEERFWANRAQHYYPEFKIAPLQTALGFAFECAPRLCFEKNNCTVPFGCHAWQEYDREFWKPYLLE